ncbi:BspA family leucine-rich repeat surface protein [Aliarcobacter butzleri]|uniref:BspA family leucine-rich repeat surface protein n=1 Tax=Aliarcobacter butzleri TaxID=28197 RepID=UPI002B247074|nr:BspA family leucine-rich repeat surface protein [Aliarcobacter butzleri]
MEKIKIIDKKHLRDLILKLDEQSDDFIYFDSKYDLTQIKDMSDMFEFCNSLVKVPFFDTSKVENMSNMFSGCTALRNLPKFNTSNVKNMSGMFDGCSSIIEIPFFDTSKVEDMSGMFRGCSSIIEIPFFDTSKVEKMWGMFRYCDSLVKVPSFDTSKVEYMIGMFSGCTTLMNLPKFNTKNVKNMSGMFSGCTTLKKLPKFNTKNVKDMSGMFEGCINITKVPLFNTSKVENMRKMFSGCSSIIEIPFFNTSKLIDTQYMFEGCNNIIEVPLFDTSKVIDMEGMFKNCSKLKKIPSFDTTNLESCGEIYEDCKSLEIIPDIKINTKKVKSFNRINMFCGCDNLKFNPELEYNENEIISEEDFIYFEYKFNELGLPIEDDYRIFKRFTRNELNYKFFQFIKWKNEFGSEEACARSFDDCTDVFYMIIEYKKTIFRSLGINAKNIFKNTKKQDVIEIRKKFEKGESTLRELRKEYCYPMYVIKKILTCKFNKYVDSRCVKSLEDFDLDKKIDDSIEYFILDNDSASKPKKIWTNEELLNIKNEFLLGKSSVYELYLKYSDRENNNSNCLIFKIFDIVDNSMDEIRNEQTFKNDFFAYLEELSSVYNYYLCGCEEFLSFDRKFILKKEHLDSTDMSKKFKNNFNNTLEEQAKKLYSEFDVELEEKYIKLKNEDFEEIKYIIKKNIFHRDILDNKINFILNESREFFKFIFINDYRLKNNVSDEELEYIISIIRQLLYVHYFNGNILNSQIKEVLETNVEFNKYKEYIFNQISKKSKYNITGPFSVIENEDRMDDVNYNDLYTEHILNKYFFRVFGDFKSDYIPNNEVTSRGSKGEILVMNILKKFAVFDDFEREYFVSIEQEYHYFDFLSEKYKIVIEYDGQQHYKPVELFGGEEAFENLKRKDKIKDNWCLDNNYKLLRLKYTLTENEIYSEISKLIGII